MTTDAELVERHRVLAPFETWDVRLVRHVVARPGSLHPRDEATLRYALALARLGAIETTDGRALQTMGVLAELRDRLAALLAPAFANDAVDPLLLGRAALQVRQLTRSARARLVVHLGDRVAPQTLERELTHRVLVLACGGGGGSGYANLGAFALLESAGLRPALIAGSSMGSVIGLFRARAMRFEVANVPRVMGELHHRRLFRPAFGHDGRFGLPGPVRLALRDGIAPYFTYDGVPLRLKDLPIPLLVTVTGIRRDILPDPVAHFRRLSEPAQDGARPLVWRMVRTLAELATMPDLLFNLVLGESPETREFDVVDAVGYSSAVPGALTYDLARDAPTEADRIQSLFERHALLRLTDGGVVDNVPARTAWLAIQRGRIGTRNAFILALDGFAPRLSTPLWLPLQRLAWENVKRSIPYAHRYFAFRSTLSPIELLPRAPRVMEIVDSAKRELIEDLPFIQRMLEPLPGLAALQAA